MQKNFELFLQDISVLKLDPENDDKACVEISNCKDIEQNIIFLSGLMNLMKSPQGNHSIRWKLHDYNGPMATDYYSIISPRSTLYIDISLAEYDNKDYVTPVAVYKDEIMPYSSYSIISDSIFYMEMEETFLFLDDFVTRHTVTFADIPQNSDEYIKYAKLYATGVIAGYEDHTFRRNQFVSRGEFVTILYRYKYSSGVLQDQEHSFFSDVPVDSYYHPYINKAHSEKWINGYDDGSFRPDDPISKQDIYLIVARLTELIANADQAIFKPKLDIAGVSPYAYNAVNALLLTKCVEAESDYTQYATRSDTVDVLYHVTYLRRAVRDYNIPCKTLFMYTSSIQLPDHSDDAC